MRNAKSAEPRLPVADYLRTVGGLLDSSDPIDLLNHPIVRAAMRALVAELPDRVTRPELATQAFLMGAGLDRARLISLVANTTWPGHDDEGAGSTARLAE